MSNNTPGEAPIIPFDLVADGEAEPTATREVDGEDVLDADIDPDRVNSAAADERAATEPDGLTR